MERYFKRKLEFQSNDKKKPNKFRKWIILNLVLDIQTGRKKTKFSFKKTTFWIFEYIFGPQRPKWLEPRKAQKNRNLAEILGQEFFRAENFSLTGVKKGQLENSSPYFLRGPH